MRIGSISPQPVRYLKRSRFLPPLQPKKENVSIPSLCGFADNWVAKAGERAVWYIIQTVRGIHANISSPPYPLYICLPCFTPIPHLLPYHRPAERICYCSRVLYICWVGFRQLYRHGQSTVSSACSALIKTHQQAGLNPKYATVIPKTIF